MLFEMHGEMVVLHATGKGVTALSWDRFKAKNKIIKLIEMADEERGRSAFKYCITRLGQQYGFLAILAIGLGIHYKDGEKTLICSEYVARALNLKFDNLDLITPVDIEGTV
jgi:hypothetical protein